MELDILGNCCNDVQAIILRLLFPSNSIAVNWNQFKIPFKMRKTIKTWNSMQQTCKKWKEISRDSIWTENSVPFVVPLLISIQSNLPECFRSLLRRKGDENWKEKSKCLFFLMKEKRVELFDIFIQFPFLAQQYHNKDLMLRAILSHEFHFVENIWEILKEKGNSPNPARLCINALENPSLPTEYGDQVCCFFYDRVEVKEQRFVEECFVSSCSRGYSSLLRRLKGHPLLDPSTINCIALNSAAKNNRVEILNILIEEYQLDPSSNGNRPLIFAVKEQNKGAVMRLLDDPRVDGSLLATHIFDCPSLLSSVLNHQNVKKIVAPNNFSGILKLDTNTIIEHMENAKLECSKEMIEHLLRSARYYHQTLTPYLQERLKKLEKKE